MPMPDPTTRVQSPVLPKGGPRGALHPEGKGRRPSSARLGIRTSLILGLTVVTLVILVGYGLSSQTASRAAQAVRRMQALNEPLAQGANLLLERLTAFDRAVGTTTQMASSGRAGAELPMQQARAQMQAAVESYFRHPDPVAGAPEIRQLIAQHLSAGAALAADSVQREQEVRERKAVLTGLQGRIRLAGGRGVPVRGQMIGRRSLVELAQALDLVRGDAEGAAGGEQAFSAVLARHAQALRRSPGTAWLQQVQEDFARARALRESIEGLDRQLGPMKRRFLEDSSVLTRALEQQLQAPARRQLLDAAERAAQAAQRAERMLAITGAVVLGVLLLVSVLLALSIIVPVRRLTAATQLLASGDRQARAPRGGAAEMDLLAASFNAMADQVERAEMELKTYQTQLEGRVSERTRQLQELAHRDPLTQLPNRRHLAVRLGHALESAAKGMRVALLFVDVDNFKSINDTLGHSFGDDVLRQIAQRLQAATAGPGTLLARLGGDEFTVLMEQVGSLEEVMERACAIVAALQQPLTVEGRIIGTSASVGASLYPDHAENAEALLRAADVALFRAKELGRNRYALYSPELYESAARSFRLEQSLKRAVEAGDLLLMYQPQVALGNFEVLGVEALLRWRKADGQISTAGEFIHIAEKSGLIHELTHWVLGEATRTAAQWRAAGWQRVCVAINVSPKQLFESNFHEHIAHALARTGLPPQALELELTETALQSGRPTIEALHRLRALGVAVALDDFGAGYSSLTSLEQLPLSRVKLDRTLIEGVDMSPRSAAIVRTIVALCQALGLEVIAEGVERPGQLQFLSQCAEVGVQGYLLARPVLAQEVLQEIQRAADRARMYLLPGSEVQAVDAGELVSAR